MTVKEETYIKNSTLLLVDDQPENLYALSKLLERERYKLDTAISGEEALRKSLNKTYSLFLLDVQMPEMDGFELADHLKNYAKTKDVPIIFLTAVHKDERYMRQGFDIGAVDYVTKPIDPPEILKQKIKIFLRLFHQQRELERAHQEIKTINEGLEKIVEQRTAELKQSNKELAAFIYKASHVFKGPIATTKGVLALASLEITDKAALDFFNMVTQSMANLESALHDLLEVSIIKQGKFKVKQVDIKHLTDELFSISQKEFRNNKVRLIIENQIKTGFYYDERWLRIILKSLINNSIQYNGNNKKDPYVKISYANKGQHLIIKVSDNGLGIRKSHMDKVFEMFFRGEPNSQGSGLGLFIVRNAVNKLNGEIDLVSQRGKCTKINVRLPLRDPEHQIK